MNKLTFTLTIDGSDRQNFAHDVAAALRSAADDISALGGSFDITNGGTVEDIQGRVIAAWEVSA